MGYKLNTEQEEQIVEWLAEGYTNVDIIKKMDGERKRDVRYIDEPWPHITNTTINTYRRKFDLGYSEMKARVFDVAASTGLGRREVLARRLAGQIGQAEHLLDLLYEEAFAFIQQGVVSGFPFIPPENPNIYEAAFSMDGAERSNNLPAHTDDVVIDAAAVDPRWNRLAVLINVIPKHVAAYEKLLALMATISGQRAAKAIDESRDTPAERLGSATTIVEELRELAARRAGATR